MVVVGFAGKKGMQCHILGVSADPDSWVANDHGCESFDRVITPRKW